MKKLFVSCLICCLLFINLNSCAYHYETEGLDKFSVNESSVGLCNGLIPPQLIEKYNYEEGNYFFMIDEKVPFVVTCDKTLLYLKYDSKTYSDAKAYTLEQLKLSEQISDIYNNYYFFENLTPAEIGNTFLKDNFPHHFVRFAYNDTNNTLVFIGFYTESNAEITADDWGSFLEEYYGDWYDFSQ